MKTNEIHNAECISFISSMPDQSVDLVLCDPPYGTTACSWDSVIPFEDMWRELYRVTKPGSMIVMTCSQPFTSALGASNIKSLKYSWVWDKVAATGHLNAKVMPMKRHEDVLVFSNGRARYCPQGTKAFNKTVRRGAAAYIGNHPTESFQEKTSYPRSILRFKKDKGFHPTQKPVALFEYLIKTYSNEGDTVLDFCSGSGTTAIACINSDRKYICIEKDPEYWSKSLDRVKNHVGADVKDTVFIEGDQTRMF